MVPNRRIVLRRSERMVLHRAAFIVAHERINASVAGAEAACGHSAVSARASGVGHFAHLPLSKAAGDLSLVGRKGHNKEMAQRVGKKLKFI